MHDEIKELKDNLMPTEWNVFLGITEGKSNGEIAAAMTVQRGTVRNYATRIYDTWRAVTGLDVPTRNVRTKLICWAHERGFGLCSTQAQPAR